ncbi:MAG: DegT/DnrJ/EryC1/StrS family aminotransferase [Victivallales bacterium]|nr:DegT/DnrJ/EryC1/StrS family aminotransferase [Victivallales bacterium]
MMKEETEFISFFKPCIGDEEIADVTECLRSGWLTTGKFAKQFEADFASYMGAEFAVAVNSCTAALHLALEAVGLGEGDLVLVPTYTFAATAEVVRYFNATPVLVDSRMDDFNMDMGKARETILRVASNEKVAGVPEGHNGFKAMIPVHFAGQAVDVKRCADLCSEFGLKLIEDCAHCCPARYLDADGSWKTVGSSADIACYSFYANKTITTGEGGMALTNNEQWADRMRVMSLHGISKDAWKRFSKEGSWYYEITSPGYKYNMSDVAAAIGVNQLKKSDSFHAARKRIAAEFTERLSGIPGIVLPVEREDVEHSWHLYIIRIEENICGISRNAFIEKLKNAGIGSSVHYMPLHMHPYYAGKYGYEPDSFPVAKSLYQGAVSLPIYPGLSDQAIDKTCREIRKLTRGS